MASPAEAYEYQPAYQQEWVEEAGRRQSARRTSEEKDYSNDPVGQYLAWIGSIPLLDAAQEVELAKRIEAGALAEQCLTIQFEGPEYHQTVHDELHNLAISRVLERKKKAGGSRSKLKITPEELHIAEMEAKDDFERLLALSSRFDNQFGRQQLRALYQDGAAAFNEFWEANLRIAFNYAKRYEGPSNGSLHLMDLVEIANRGVEHAIKKFDYTQGFKFSTYAVDWITQHLGRGIPEDARAVRIPYDKVQLIRRLDRIEKDFESKAITPTIEQLAEKMGAKFTPEKVEELRLLRLSIASIDKEVGEDTRLGDYIAETHVMDPESAVVADEMRSNIQQLLEAITDDERYFLEHRYGLNGCEPHSHEQLAKIYDIKPVEVAECEQHLLQSIANSGYADVLRPYLIN